MTPILANPIVIGFLLVAVIVIVALIITLARRDIRNAVREEIRSWLSGYQDPGLAAKEFPPTIQQPTGYVHAPAPAQSAEVRRAMAEHIARTADEAIANRGRKLSQDVFDMVNDEAARWQSDLDDEEDATLDLGARGLNPPRRPR